MWATIKITGVIILIVFYMALMKARSKMRRVKVPKVKEYLKPISDYCNDDCYICSESGNCMFSEVEK